MYKSYEGRVFGRNENQLLLNGVPVGGSMPTGLGRGNTYYVDSNVAASEGTSPSTAVAGIQAAHTLCTANQGDVIVVLPSHTEAITAAGGITISKAGISIVGLGYGNQRPSITFTTANTATFLVTGAGCYITNIRFGANFLAVATGIGVTAVDCWLDNCVFYNVASSKNFTNPINCTGTTTATADALRVINCRWITSADTSGAAFIRTAGSAAGWLIQNNYVTNPATATAQLINVLTGKLLTDAYVAWNTLLNLMTANELFITNDGTTNTGVFHNNYCGHADVTGTHDPGWDAGGFRLFNNLSVSVDNLQGVVVPAIDVNL